MADKYCDHNSYPAWALTPTWSVPQDGDGTLSTVSGTSATVSIGMSGAAAAATNTFSVMGAVLTCVASGATANQFNAGSGTTLIDNLVSAINLTTNTSAVAAQATNWTSTNALNKVVFARRNGNNLEIMTRAGSATYNGLTAVAWVGITGLTGPYTWSGGVSGCWNALFNDANMAANQFTIYTYGVWFANCLAGARPVQDDVLNCRANNQVITSTANTNLSITSSIFDMLVDNSDAIWAGTTGKTLKISASGTSGQLELRLDTNGRYSFRSNLAYGLIFALDSTNSSLNLTIVQRLGGNNVFFERVRFHDNATGATSKLNPCNPGFGGNSKSFTFYNCEFKFSRSGTPYGIGGEPSGGLGTPTTTVFDNCDIVHDSLTSAHPGFFSIGNFGCSVRVTNSRLTSGAVTPPFMKSYNTNGSGHFAFAENLTGFTLSSATIGFNGNSTTPMAGAEQCIAIMQNIGPLKGYRYESNSQLIDWLPGAGYPTLTATMPDSTPWSLRSYWAGGTLVNSRGSISTSVMLTKRAPTAADAVRDITMELLIETAVGPSVTNAMLCLDVAYVDDTGAMRTQSTRLGNWLLTAGSAIATSSASWTKNSYAGTHSAYKLALTTAYPVKAGSDVVAKLMMLSPSPVSASNIFVEPEIAIV